ncbi:structural maintenance of chromosomes protein 5 [Phtheirospermum japonicum]|uniref:Structural maintenance of chromosomes protein 5 n=1 Tax=Phtheirospermum japonicum TaxID=374723 RepID=A0A830C2J9_9LAMI|nr:structural maintenance of chromosomes protein 5 [Phtheirospermum japonicum]
MADEPKRKKPKISRGDDDYMPGNITLIQLCNFMTFDKMTCEPASRLNLVVGPNGSGKSSLVCAIALGLGGEPQLLGRATSVGAYVKRGEESGFIKITLRGESKEEPITITRKIDTRNKSEWLFNGKVLDFLVTKQSQTEKAVGDPQLPIQHRSLITKSQELKKFERAVATNKGSLDQLKAQNAELEKDVERVRQREDFLAKAESMKKKLPWLKYDIKKAEYIEARNQEGEAKKKLDEAAKALSKLKEPIEKQKGEKAKLEAKVKKMNGLLDTNMKKRMQLFENYNQLGVLVQGTYDEVKDLRHQEESRQQRISIAKDNLAAAEAELENLPPYEPPKHKMEQFNARIMELEESAKEIRYQKKEKEKHLYHHRTSLTQCIDRLREMENVNNKRLQALRNSGADMIFEAYKWVQEHRSNLNKEVYGPVLLEVNVTNRVHADYLEGQVAYYIWKAFITQDPEDRDFLAKNMKQMKFECPVINHVSKDGRHREPFHTTDEMRRLGISSRLDQVFEAPHAVKEVLIGQFGLDSSYIGSKETDEKADLAHRLGIMDIWTPENHYHWSRSRYGGHVSGNVESVDKSRLLLCNLDVKEIESVKTKKVELEEKICGIEADLRALQTALRQKEDEAAELQREREEIVSIMQSKKKKQREMEHLVNQRRMKLKSIESEDDPDAAIAKLTDKVKELKIQRFHCVIEIKNLLTEAVAFRRSFAETNMGSIELEAKIKEMESNSKQQEKLAVQASLFLDQC